LGLEGGGVVSLLGPIGGLGDVGEDGGTVGSCSEGERERGRGIEA